MATNMITDDCLADSCPTAAGFIATASSPSLVGTAIMLAAFGILCLANIFAVSRTKAIIYTLAMIVGLGLEVLGFTGRLLLGNDLASKRYFAMFMLGTTLGPALIASAIFLTLPHLMAIYGQDFGKLPDPVWLLYIYLGADVFTIAFEGIGCGFSARGLGRDETQQGIYILAVGLTLQILSILSYLLIFWLLMAKVSRRQAFLSRRFESTYLTVRFSAGQTALQTASALILLRTVAQMAQVLRGLSSTIFQSDVYTLVLDGASVALAALLLSLFPPDHTFGNTWPATSPNRKRAHFGLLAIQQGQPGSPLYSPQQFSPYTPSHGQGCEQVQYHAPNGYKEPLSPPPASNMSAGSTMITTDSMDVSGRRIVTAPRANGVGIQPVPRSMGRTRGGSQHSSSAPSAQAESAALPPYERPTQHFQRVPFVPPTALTLRNDDGYASQQVQAMCSPPLSTGSGSQRTQFAWQDSGQQDEQWSVSGSQVTPSGVSGPGSRVAAFGRLGGGSRTVQQDLVETDDLW